MPYEYTTPKLAQLRRATTPVFKWAVPRIGWHVQSAYDIKHDTAYVCVRRVLDGGVVVGSAPVTSSADRPAVAAAIRQLRKDIRAHG
jgi:hypothetical protein